MKKRYLVFMSLLTMMMCSCNQQTPSDSISSDSREVEPIIKPYDRENDRIILGDKISPQRLGENGDIGVEDFTNIFQIVDEMTFDEQHQLYVPNLKNRLVYYSLSSRHYQIIPGTITYSENGYFASVGEDRDDANYYFHDGIIYNYVYCNQEIDLLKNSYSVYLIEKMEWIELLMEFIERDDGYIVHTQYTFEKDGNHYVIGSKMFNRNINTNSKAVQYVNEHSTFAIPLGCPKENVLNLNDYVDIHMGLMNPTVSIVVENYLYSFTNFINGSFIDEEYVEDKTGFYRGSSTHHKETLAKIVLEGNNNIDNICGVTCTMSIEEAKNHLINQGFNYQEFNVEYGFNDYEMNYFFSMENVMIVIGKSRKNSDLIKIQTYIDLFDFLALSPAL